MKKVIFTLFSAAMSLSASAQLLITYNNAAGQHPGTVVIKTDNIHSVKKNGGGLPNFDPANNMHWDMSNVQYNTQMNTITYDTCTNLFFSPAKHSSEITYSNTGFLPYVTHLQFEIRSTGMFAYGEHLDRQAFPLGFITGDMGDSLVILNQDIDYSANITNIPYPAAAGITFWSNNFHYNTNLELTYLAQGYNQSPITKVSHVTSLDSAIGWGTISGLHPDNTQGGEVDVLQVKNITTVVDSFYNNGVPVPANVLSTFNLSQGQTNNLYQYNWYRRGEVTAMLNVAFSDAQFTTIHDINFHRERMPFPAGVASASTAAGSMMIYPNPATQAVNISLADKAAAVCEYELINVTGQIIAKGSVPASSGNAVITLGDVPAGTYYISVTSNGAQVSRAPLSIVK